MSYENFIAFRYLMAKRRSRVVSIITLISIAGVSLGVTAMIVVLSVMGGFKKDLKEKILGTKAHVVVQPEDGEEMTNVREVLEKARQLDKVAGASPFIDAEVMASSPTNLNGVMLRGIDPQTIGEVSDLDQSMKGPKAEGKIAYLEDAGPLLEKLEEERNKVSRSLQEEIEAARKQLEKEKKEARERKQEGSETETDAGMPPIAGPSEGGSGGGEADSGEGDGGMPSIAGGDDSSSDAGSDLPGILVGKELAKSLQVELGSEINVVTPQGEMGPTGPIPRTRPFRVVGIFYTGMYEYDANSAYTTLGDARDFLDLKGVSGVELKAQDVNDAFGVANTLEKRLPEGLEVLDWKEMNRSLFYALKLEKIAMFVVLTFIILVASFSIIAMLIMIVLEKKRAIAVLKSMGMTDGGVMRIFIYQGVAIGALGAGIGLVLGLTICFLLVEYGFPLNSEVYYISTLPVDINRMEIFLVVACTILISFLATIYPSRKASRLSPVEGLRYE